MNLKTLLLVIFISFPSISVARPMITDLSERKIEIDAHFTGKEILLYGARVEAGNIVVVIRGPGGHFVVRKKEKVAGMWMNTEHVRFKGVPQFYQVASSRPLERLDADAMLQAVGIGVDTVKFSTKPSSASVEINEFQKALTDTLQADELFDFDVINLPLLEGTLFRIRVNFPEKIPEGIYTAEIYSFNEGQLQGMQSIPVRVSKVGAEAFIHSSSQDYPALYGLFAVILAIGMGWGAGRIFRKV